MWVIYNIIESYVENVVQVCVGASLLLIQNRSTSVCWLKRFSQFGNKKMAGIIHSSEGVAGTDQSTNTKG